MRNFAAISWREQVIFW